MLKLGRDIIAKVGLEIGANNEHNFAKPCSQRIKHRVVENGFTRWAHGVNLLQAAITRTHTSSEHNKGLGHSLTVVRRL